jgi:RNA polymerase-binding transcription factor DksA
MSIEDIAQEVELLDWERNNRPRTVRRLLEPTEPGYGPAECGECEDQMPDLRRAMGCVLCVDCTELAERRKRLRAA